MKINKLVLLILILILNCCKNNLIWSFNSQIVLKGVLQVPEKWENNPEFRVIFNGKQAVSDEDGFYSFPVEEIKDKFHFLICKNIEKYFEKINTIKNLKVKIEKPYKYFSFKKDIKVKKWVLKEKKLANKNFIIPNDCIIVLIDPKYIEKIEPWNISLNNKFLNLPKIVFKNNLDEKKVRRASAKSILTSMDVLPFHEKITNKKRNLAANVQCQITQ